MRTVTNCLPKRKDSILGKESKKRGEEVHEIIANILQGKRVMIPPHLDGYVRSVAILLPSITPVAIEKFISSPDKKYSGRIDCLGHYQGRLTLFDWKTSRDRKPIKSLRNAFMQIGGYSHILRGSGSEVEVGIVAVITPIELQLFSATGGNLRSWEREFLSQ